MRAGDERRPVPAESSKSQSPVSGSTSRRQRVTASRQRSKSSDERSSGSSHHSDSEMRDWRSAIRKPINYTVANDVVRLQTTFVTVVAVLGTTVLLMLYLLLPSRVTSSYPSAHDDHLHAFSSSSSGSGRDCPCIPVSSYDATYPLSRPENGADSGSGMRYRIALIADLDLDSKSQTPRANSSASNSHCDGGISSWHSFLLKGYLTYDSGKEDAVSIVWDANGRQKLTSSLSSAGRGMELSELSVFNGKLYSCDDRTGIVYQIPLKEQSDSPADTVIAPLPWLILNDGNGLSAKGFKCEWMTVKDHLLYIGGFGKEWTSTSGELLNFDPQWVKVASPDGAVRHVDWRQRFLALMKAAGIWYPGYIIHESAAWSHHHRKWFFLPRRASHAAYNEIEDERKGTNLLITADESFAHIEVKKVGAVVPTLGYSSFKFIPGSRDRLIVALKSQEDAGRVATFISVISSDGRVIVPDERVGTESIKYEGIEFI